MYVIVHGLSEWYSIRRMRPHSTIQNQHALWHLLEQSYRASHPPFTPKMIATRSSGPGAIATSLNHHIPQPVNGRSWNSAPDGRIKIKGSNYGVIPTPSLKRATNDKLYYHAYGSMITSWSVALLFSVLWADADSPSIISNLVLGADRIKHTGLFDIDRVTHADYYEWSNR